MATLNAYQAKNMSLLSFGDLQKLKNNDWSRTPSPLMACVICGRKQISTYIMRFFNYDPTRFECYDCQKKKINQ